MEVSEEAAGTASFISRPLLFPFSIARTLFLRRVKEMYCRQIMLSLFLYSRLFQSRPPRQGESDAVDVATRYQAGESPAD